MPLHRYVTLGRSGLRVSPLCLGCMTFGEDWGWGSSVPESQAVLDRFLEAGGNFIDTANVYTKGHSETIIGEHRAKLEEVSKPALNFPAAFLENVPNFAYGGTTINRRSSQVPPMMPQTDAERY